MKIKKLAALLAAVLFISSCTITIDEGPETPFTVGLGEHADFSTTITVNVTADQEAYGYAAVLVPIGWTIDSIIFDYGTFEPNETAEDPVLEGGIPEGYEWSKWKTTETLSGPEIEQEMNMIILATVGDDVAVTEGDPYTLLYYAGESHCNPIGDDDSGEDCAVEEESDFSWTDPVEQEVTVVEGFPGEGSGEEDDPYQISNCGELQMMNDDLDAYYEFAEDIDCSYTSYWNLNPDYNGGADDDADDDPGADVEYFGFQPIGNGNSEEEYFTGHLDGNGYSVSNIYMNRIDGGQLGLFGYVEGGTITNVVVDYITIYTNTELAYISVGGLVGRLNSGEVTYSNVTNSDIYPSSVEEVGMLVGSNYGTISNSYANGEIINAIGTSIGGLVGDNYGTISESRANTSVSAVGGDAGASRVGGFAGNSTGTITDSFSESGVSGLTYVGGFIGYNSGDISRSYSEGSIEGKGYATGGFAGYNESNITDCYSVSAVNDQTEEGTNIGGFAGMNSGDIYTSYSSGNTVVADSSTEVGGFVGYNGGDSVYSSFSVGEVLNGEETFPAGEGVGVFAGANYPDSGYGIYDSGVINQENPYVGYNDNDETPDESESLYEAESESDYYLTSNIVYTGGENLWDFDEVWRTHANSLPTFREAPDNEEIIDSWNAFNGSDTEDRAYKIVKDNEDNIYIVGRSKDTWNSNGETGIEPLHTHSSAGSADVFVLKLDSDGNYLWHTFYGGGGYDYGFSAAVDADNNIYITGFSEFGWDGPDSDAPITPFTDGNEDSFVLKLDSEGEYQWHTFYGSDFVDEGQGIAVDGDGNAYVAIKSYSGWTGPESEEPLQAYSEGDDAGSQVDLAVLKLDTDGAYQWHTFYGSDAYTDEDNPGDEPTSITVDGDANIYVGGFSISSWTGPEEEAPLNDFTESDNDAFVLKLDTNGAYLWHTFYGSTEKDWINSLYEQGGYLYATGFSGASWNGPEENAPLHTYSGDNDIMVLKLDDDGAYQWHTFYGSESEEDYGIDITLDDSSGVYVAGRSLDTWDGDEELEPLHDYTDGADIMILKLNDSGIYQSHTFYGSELEDNGQSLVVDDENNIYVAGYSKGTWQIEEDVDPINAYSGDKDIVVLKTTLTDRVIEEDDDDTGGSSGGSVRKEVAEDTSETGHTFEDSVNHWAQDYINDLYDQGLIKGYDDAHFGPDNNITRAELTKIVVNMMGYSLPTVTESSFSDVALTDWYSPYIEAAKTNRLVEGYEDGTFKPDNKITRAEAVKIIVLAKYNDELPPYQYLFTDVLEADWFAPYITYAYLNGIINGYGNGYFGPNNNITRAEVAKIISLIMAP